MRSASADGLFPAHAGMNRGTRRTRRRFRSVPRARGDEPEQIELMKSRKALNRAVVEKLVSGGAWSAILAMAAALWMWIQSHVGGAK